MSRIARLLVLAAVLGFSDPAAGQGVDWARYADVETLEVLTTDEDGAPRATTVWLLVQDGDAYLRTGGTTWGGNVERDPAIALRSADQEIPVRAELVTDPTTLERVASGFRAKYGFMDRVAGLFRFGDVKIMRLAPR